MYYIATTHYGINEYDLKLKHTFTISRESIDFQPSLIVELKSDGFSGFGETTSNPLQYLCTRNDRRFK
jgi:L-alanine-DL-glutamate epimerase-like enolase superfamily enzyme